MLGRVLLDNESWFITAGILGMSIKVHDKDRDLTRRATRYERLYLLEMLEYMKQSGICVGPGSPEFEEIIQLFAHAIFLRGRPTWEALFRATRPKDWIDSFLANDEDRREVQTGSSDRGRSA